MALDSLFPPVDDAAMNPLAGLVSDGTDPLATAMQSYGGPSGSSPSGLGSLPTPPAGPAALPPANPTYTGMNGLSNLNAYIASRYSPERGQALQDQMDAANQGLAAILANPATDDRSKWFAAASALGRPTKSGQFSEAAANGLDAFTNAESADFQKREQYKLLLAQMIQQRAQQQYDLFNQQQQGALEKAASLAVTSTAPGHGITPIVKVVGGKMVSFDPLTQTTTQLAGGDEAMASKLWGQYMEQAKNLGITKANEIQDYVSARVGDAMSKVRPYSVQPPAAADPNAQIASLIQMRDDAAAANNFALAAQLQARISTLRAMPPAAPAPAPVAAPAAPTVAPGPGQVPQTDRVAILQQEYQDTQAKIATAQQQLGTTSDPGLQAQLQDTIDRATRDLPTIAAQIQAYGGGNAAPAASPAAPVVSPPAPIASAAPPAAIAPFGLTADALPDAPATPSFSDLIGGNGASVPPAPSPASPPITAAPTVPNYAVKEKMAIKTLPDGTTMAIPENGVPGAPITASTILGADGKPIPSGGLTEDALERDATRLAHGDLSVLTGIGRGTQGAANLMAVRNRAAQIATAEGISPDEQIARGIALLGEKSGARALGTRTANLQVASSELNEFADQALVASANVPRGKFVPLNKAIQMVEAGTSDPELGYFVLKNQAVVNAFAQVIGRGTTSVSAQQHALELLGTAPDQESYAKKLQALREEAAGANKSTAAVQAAQKARITGATGTSPAPSGGSSPPLTNAQGWTLHVDAQGNKAYVSPDGKQLQEVK